VNEGLVLTHKLLIKNIEKEGGLQIWPEKNQHFDETEHEAVDFSGQIPKNAKVKKLVIHGWKLK
jgi:molecular chaperone GrpE (heat shock protein)